MVTFKEQDRWLESLDCSLRSRVEGIGNGKAFTLRADVRVSSAYICWSAEQWGPTRWGPWDISI